VRRAALPILAISAFLAIAGIYHLLAPVHSEKILSKPSPVRVIGFILSLLGVWCLFFPALASYLVGVPTLLSGLSRLVFPRRMIAVNTWTSRYMHGVLMLLGAVGCVLLSVV
jgi:uncharacterized membrane protein HdeD (DUF308 family)